MIDKQTEDEYQDILSKYLMAQKIAEDFRYNTNLDVVINTYAIQLNEYKKKRNEIQGII